MPFPKQILCAALVAGCFLSATVAEARFGKSGGSGSSGSSSSGHTSGGPPHGHGGGKKSRVHDATPVGRDSDDSSPNNGGGQDRGPRRTVIIPIPAWISVSGTYYRGYRPRLVTREPEESRSPVMVRMGVEANALREGGAVALNLGIEERRWGISTRLTALALNTDDGSEGMDHLQLADVNVTFAPLAGARGRLRLEAGVAMARAPDVTFIGPNLALSFERCLFGPLDVEGRLQWVPYPHLQLDGQAGLAVHLGVLTLRAGWRGLLLDDRGHVDGVVHRDKMGGPFGGLGLHF
ncbi:hypothetical protein [Archangium sp.]|uniref:hypothetical protein n=1 Tax=Archangium sp. TaxID=1872627 RepID=UPI002D3E6797|nr:hypothetical protein [Archangium sp.]HYO53397.1 hypothetical protein [Archangium sp.]